MPCCINLSIPVRCTTWPDDQPIAADAHVLTVKPYCWCTRIWCYPSDRVHVSSNHQIISSGFMPISKNAAQTRFIIINICGYLTRKNKSIDNFVLSGHRSKWKHTKRHLALTSQRDGERVDSLRLDGCTDLYCPPELIQTRAENRQDFQVRNDGLTTGFKVASLHVSVVASHWEGIDTLIT